MQLAARIRESGILIDDPVIVARTGWTTGELASAITDSGVQDYFDFVTLLIGVNNQYRGYDTATYRAELIGLIDRAVDFARGKSGRVILVSIPDWGVMPFAEGRNRDKISSEIDLFNDIMRNEAQSKGVIFIDITPVSRSSGKEPGMVAEDGLHPSGMMYSLWVKEVLPGALRILRK